MARRRRSTRKGQTRKTARKAYTGVTRRTRARAAYGRARYATKRRAKSAGMGLIKGRSGKAIMECGWITAGGAAGLLAGKYMAGSYAGMSSDTILGASALAYGVMQNNAKAIYIGFGALYPRIQNQMATMIA